MDKLGWWVPEWCLTSLLSCWSRWQFLCWSPIWKIRMSFRFNGKSSLHDSLASAFKQNFSMPASEVFLFDDLKLPMFLQDRHSGEHAESIAVCQLFTRLLRCRTLCLRQVGHNQSFLRLSHFLPIFKKCNISLAIFSGKLEISAQLVISSVSPDLVNFVDGFGLYRVFLLKIARITLRWNSDSSAKCEHVHTRHRFLFSLRFSC